MSEVVQRYWQATEKREEMEDPRHAVMREMAAQFISRSAIGDRLGISKRRVADVLGRIEDMQAYNAGVTGEIRRLWDEEHLSMEEIAERLGAQVARVHLVLTGHVPASKALPKRNQEPTCGRCGLLLSETPGCVEGLCGVCCEEIARGVIYRDGDLPGEKLAAIRAALGVAA